MTVTVKSTLWKNKPNYRCPECAYTTLDQERMRVHLQATHHVNEKVDFQKPKRAESNAREDKDNG